MEIEILNKRHRTYFAAGIILVFLYTLCRSAVDFSFTKGIMAVPESFKWMFFNFIPDKTDFLKIKDIGAKLLETVLLAVAATTAAGSFALILSILGSKMTGINKFISILCRAAASVSRNIPDAVWAMIFLLSFGQNIFTGFLAVFFASFGILTRAFMESFDEMDAGILEALYASGASYWQVIFNAVIPSKVTGIISWLLYMIETNIRSSTLIGILTGTGIGFLFELYYKSMKYNIAGLIILLIIISVFSIEFISNKLRKAVL